MKINELFKKLFGTKHNRVIKKLLPLVERINQHEQEYQKLPEAELLAMTERFRERIKNGENLDDLLPEAYAVVKNACRRMLGRKIMVTGDEIVWDMIPYDVQLIGGIHLHTGGIAEMQTGEGKTLVAIMPLYLNALSGRNCQLVTTNDYLARRDSEWVGAVLRYLGLEVGCIQHDMSPPQRRVEYGKDITYGTNSEFGFDYLRDMGMARAKEHMVQRDHYFVIIDEVDNILIDEARTPLIISGPVPESTQQYDQYKPDIEKLVRKQNQLCTQLVNEAKAVFDRDDATEDERLDATTNLLKVKVGLPKHKQFMRLMEDGQVRKAVEKMELQMHSDQYRGMMQELKDTLYFTIDERHHDANLGELGRVTLRPDDPDAFVIPDLATQFADLAKDESALTDEERSKMREQMQRSFDERSEMLHNIAQLLRAYCLYEKEIHYIVQENKVVIVDEFTGRQMPGRRFSEGLHSALEAKENVTIEGETQTMATITIQNYFRMYDKLAGMTGTAETEENEFHDIYKLGVLVVPTNRPCVRADHNDKVYKTRREKYRAIVEEIAECHQKGQPVLLGTISVEVSEILSRMLRRMKIPHNVLNAKYHQQEAEIIKLAGQRGAVTIATNMAGRGTDIRLGEGVREAGGLHVIGSERHDSRRIDRQLRGRCARQGDPGSSRFYVSFEDDLMRLFGSDRITSLMEKLGMHEGEELAHPLLNRTIEGAQRKVEQHHYSIRKRTLQYDDVMNKQREVVYGRRKEILTCEKPRDLLFDYLDTVVFDHVQENLQDEKHTGEPLDREGLLHWLQQTFPIGFSNEDLKMEAKGFSPDALTEKLLARIEEVYQAKELDEDPEAVHFLERQIMLAAHDKPWREHLYAMDNLRQEISLVSYGQRDPLVEYKRVAFEEFDTLIRTINNEIGNNVFRSATSLKALNNMLAAMPRREVHREAAQFDGGREAATSTSGMQATSTNREQEAPKAIPFHRDQPKIGRNDPCPCGSGEKYKKCHGRYSS